MENSVENNIRAVLRAENKDRRRYQRDYNLSSRRNIVKETICNLERIITRDEVEVIARNIKVKRNLNINDLALLKLSFIQNVDNIVHFLKIKGALPSLIRELTGSNSNFQLLAAECLCNLALGSPKSCNQLAKAASPYLISHLQGMNYNLMNMSVWTLGNLVGSDIRTWEVIKSQGISQTFIQLLTVPELLDNTLYAVVQFLKVGLQNLDYTEFKEIGNVLMKELSSNPSPNRCLVLFLLSTSQHSKDVLMENNIVEKCLSIIDGCNITSDTVKSVTCLVRILANLIPDPSGVAVSIILAKWKQMQLIINNLLVSGYSHFKPELMWLVGNIVNHPNYAIQETILSNTHEFLCLFK